MMANDPQRMPFPFAAPSEVLKTVAFRGASFLVSVREVVGYLAIM